MKFFVVALIAFAACVNAAPSETPLTDSEAFEIINRIFDRVDEATNPAKHVVKEIVHNEAERTCILNQLKKFNAVERILHYDRQSGDEDENKNLSIFFLHYFAGLCLEDVNVLAEFLFDNTMTFNILYRAFITEPEFKEYADRVHCANKYALDHKVFEANEYPFNVEINNADQCEKEKSFIREVINEVVFTKLLTHGRFKENKQCYENVLSKLETFVLRFVLLIQFELNEAQHNSEEAHFVKEFHAITDAFAECALASGNQV
jgi:hypothetical protein